MKRKWANHDKPGFRSRVDIYPHILSENLKSNPDTCIEIQTSRSKLFIELEEPLLQTVWNKPLDHSSTFVSDRSKVEKYKRLHEERQIRLQKHENLHLHKTVNSSEVGPREMDLQSNKHDAPTMHNNTSQKPPQNQLLSQKYQPTKFVELLTDHNLNREALRWLKSWDDLVFNQKSNLAPKVKILLLAGPPGVGKTVLAYCIANHCGYEIMEINASDDRSQSTLIQQVKARVQSKSIINNEKPKLVLLDEIDGALGGNSISDANTTATGALIGLAKNNKDPLLRPIICTCNDLYSPSLKALRSYAKVIVFKRGDGNNERVVSRLKSICTKEGIQVPLNLLHQLAQTHEGDIRSCLNALQMIQLGYFASNQSAALKDVEKGYFDLMQYIFDRTQQSYNQFQQFFQYDSNNFNLVDGCFANYLSQPFSDPYLLKIVKSIDALSFADLLNTTLLQSMQYTLGQYFSVPLFTMHYFCRSNEQSKPKVALPLEHYQAKRRIKELRALVHEFREGVTPFLSTYYYTNDVVLDLTCPLFDILSNSKIRKDISDVYLLDAKEKEILHNLHDVHKVFGLRYEYNTSLSRYFLRPSIFEFIREMRKDIPEEGAIFGIPLCQYMNQNNRELHPKQKGHSKKMTNDLRQDVEVKKDSPFKKSTPALQKLNHVAAIKFVFEDSASKAIRHRSRIEEWL